MLNYKNIKDYVCLNNGIILKQTRENNFINTIDPVITDNCNLACPHCWGFNCGTSLKLDQFLEILKLSKLLGINDIQFTGGEPLLNKDIFIMSKISKEMGFNNRLRSNFSIKLFDNEFLLKIVNNFDSVYISVDGMTNKNFELRPSKQYINLKNKSSEIFNKMAKDIFLVITKNIRNLINIKLRYNSNIKINVCSVIQKNNLNEIESLIKFFNDFELNFLEFTQVILEKNNVNYITEEIFLNKIFNEINIENSINRIKIKPFSNSRCLMCKTNNDIILAGIDNIKIGNLINFNYEDIFNNLNKYIKNNYINYYYIPFKNMLK